MTKTRITLSLTLVMIATAAMAQSSAQKSFDQIKSLTGTWEGKNSQGQPVTVSFRVTAGGSAVMSEILGQGKEDMITMFHLDGDRLLMTHYCGAGNQPRMQVSASDARNITFDFVDATNLATPESGHMHQLVISMPDADHHTEQWNFADHGKEMKEVFDLHRKG
jgi:hypothetical protein